MRTRPQARARGAQKSIILVAREARSGGETGIRRPRAAHSHESRSRLSSVQCRPVTAPRTPCGVGPSPRADRPRRGHGARLSRATNTTKANKGTSMHDVDDRKTDATREHAMHAALVSFSLCSRARRSSTSSESPRRSQTYHCQNMNVASIRADRSVRVAVFQPGAPRRITRGCHTVHATQRRDARAREHATCS